MEMMAKTGILLVCILSLCAVPSTAAINTITQGNVVFIGEQGLDITSAMGPDTRVGWWASGADLASSTPTKIIDVSTSTNMFMVTPSEFSGYTGNWYRLDGDGKSDGIAFSVADPQINIHVEDTTTSVDEALNWIPTGDSIRFRIDTNLVQMASQRSYPPLITINIQSPDGASYTSLYDAGGNPSSVVRIPVTANPFYTNAIWNMGDAGRYPTGTYTLSAECDVNMMKDNYPVTGKTISSQIYLLNQGGYSRRVNPPVTISQTPVPLTSVVPQGTTGTIHLTPAVTAITLPPVPVTTPYSPIPSQTKSPGFEATLAGAALLAGLVCFTRKE